MATASTTPARDHTEFMRDQAGVEPPKALGALQRILVAKGKEEVAPEDRFGLHPLMIPLARDPETGGYTGVLRPLRGRGTEAPIAEAHVEHGGALRLVATSAERLARFYLVEEDAREGGREGPAAKAAGKSFEELHAMGTVEKGKVNAFLARQVGGLPGVVERLAWGHMDKGDKESALVTADWYKRQDHFPGWSQPLNFSAWLLNSIGRDEEARDSARAALAMAPWWTLGASFGPTRQLANLPGRSVEELKDLLAGFSMSADGMPQGLVQAASGKEDPRELAFDRAMLALDRAVAGEAAFASVAPTVAEELDAAGLAYSALLVRSYPTSP